MDTTTTTDLAHAAGAYAAIAAGIRTLVGALKMPQLNSVWLKMPWWARPLTLLVLASLGGLFDALIAGQKWYWALASAISGLGTAVISYEWWQRYKEAQATPTPVPTTIVPPTIPS